MKLLFCNLIILIVSSVCTSVVSDCISGHFSVHPTSCDKYLICDNEEFVEMECAPGTVFNRDINVCDWPSNVTDCVDGEYVTTTRETEFTSPTPDCSTCQIELAPLYHMVRPSNDHHFYTPSKTEADKCMAYGMTYDVSPGLIALNGLDCNCRASLQYPTRLYRVPSDENPIDEHVFLLNGGEIGHYVNTLKYRWEGYEQYHFYCSTTAGSCGATVPLHRYLKNGKHYFSTTMEGQEDATYEGVLCYIWPNSDA
ncbi:hypothetical protein HA402_008945 [Bradysia odoriphaga]|nr:hypothetical protein HA402_008945 [Bradysia odoriphaga]